MKVSFLSLDSQLNKVYFQTEALYENHVLVFEDKSCEGTKIKITLGKDNVSLSRFGKTQMEMIFDRKQITFGKYKNDEGLEFTFEIQCHKLNIQDKKLLIQYDLLLDNQVISNHSLSITLFDKKF